MGISSIRGRLGVGALLSLNHCVCSSEKESRRGSQTSGSFSRFRLALGTNSISAFDSTNEKAVLRPSCLALRRTPLTRKE